ncbi:MAG: AbrB/MazE/SpoVT family DNA-binding domain-containing protein [Nitrososphaerota archaeon]|nr:AbrB/MazE/SpoVT family DNA-binding domain-containing protein [Nitrososphaerota archaeon]MDG6913155.1 AbrB/MazE/SpoVT family DNA-binding domain-containing protein [Nitrososphaerota archaeon]MDG6937092.1 AbrB/MazE/SpoVT family DNA-binding domain-containing protein [Nitrososphaerota archaeon]MDG6971048.1 AbrB/MazE/SpoVT family DNA-binding domain-containing protein [Nitrososphaerota archaeon]MDG6972334.1 AbrB/MazE/SpoVT family DNA-binding domain-containing protein [Nitrososphaerota archaeon]
MPVIFRVLLGKTGNSLRVTLPRPIVEGFQWKEGDEIVLYVSEGQITLEKGRGAGELKKGAKAKGQKP